MGFQSLRNTFQVVSSYIHLYKEHVKGSRMGVGDDALLVNPLFCNEVWYLCYSSLRGGGRKKIF